MENLDPVIQEEIKEIMIEKMDESSVCENNNILPVDNSETTSTNTELNIMNDDQDSESSFDTNYEFIDNMLEEGVDFELMNRSSKQQKFGKRNSKKMTTEIKQKTVLIRKGHDLFEILPEGWVEIIHFSGIPIYLDKKTRVCTTSKPYYLGTDSARKHQIPLSAIPCLQYKTELEKEKKISKECPNNSLNEMAPLAKVETLEENRKEKSLNYSKVREYCQSLFEFKTVTVRKFSNWAERRKHEQLKKMAQRPILPESTKLITCSIPKTSFSNSNVKSYKKEFIMNPAGKSDVCILHEYVQHTGRTQPKYVFKELENVSKPYCATVYINEMEYGKGFGSSKKEAKTEAARASLDILIPDLKNTTNFDQKKSDSLNDLSFFDNINIEDQRVSELLLKAGQYSPYQILVECLKRLYGIEDMDIKTDVKLIKHQKIEFKMVVGTHEATVICKNKREGKQRAAQKILKILHPNLKSWGSLLKLYGQGSCKTPKEKKEEAQKITELQNNACSNRPNYAILSKLKEEMLKLREHNQLASSNSNVSSLNIRNLDESLKNDNP